MSSKIKKIVILICVALAAQVFAQAPPVVIDPSVPEFPDAPKLSSSGKRFWVSPFTGGAGAGESVGGTRAGRRKTSPIVCDPVIADALRNTLLWELDEQGLLADGEDEAELVIGGKVTEFKMEESPKTLHQVMNISLRAEVEVRRVSDGGVARTFRLQSGGERTAFNATKKAEFAAREAVQSAVAELLKGLDSL